MAIVELIFDVVDEVNLEFPENKRIKKSLESELYGGNSNLDYSDFINFMSKIEKKFEEKFGEKIEIFNKISLQKKEFVFENIESLASFIEEMCHKKGMKYSR